MNKNFTNLRRFLHKSNQISKNIEKIYKRTQPNGNYYVSQSIYKTEKKLDREFLRLENYMTYLERYFPNGKFDAKMLDRYSTQETR